MTAASDFTKFIKGVEADLKRSGDNASLKRLGQYALEIIRDRTRAGFGVPVQGGKQKRLPALSDSYKKRRRGMKLSPFTKPSKSNLTLSGAMLASLRVSTRKYEVIISPSGNDAQGVSNQDKANWQEDLGRIFLRLSKDEMELITLFYQTEILDKNIK